jgi:hypothetical protein
MTPMFSRLLNYGPSEEQVTIIRIGPIMSVMGYSQHHIQLEETHKYVLNHRWAESKQL